MIFFKKFLIVYTSSVVLFIYINCDAIDDSSITFRVIPGSGKMSFNSSFNQPLSSRGCDPTGKFFIIIHGWMESWHTEWVQDLISNLTIYRGGCIIFMDYSNYSVNPNYFLLTPQFQNISDILLRFMKQLDAEKFDFDNGYIFGFSFGAWLAIKAAKTFGVKRFAQIDAGPGFDLVVDLGDHSLAAQNVQCIHTNSGGLGTIIKNCSQNWHMGVCGVAQLGAQPFPKGHHGLCPFYYTAAFKHDFIAWHNIYACYSTRAVTDFEKPFKMGYMETLERKKSVIGDLFSPTSILYPFNEIPGRIVQKGSVYNIKDTIVNTTSELFDYSSLISDAQNITADFDEVLMANEIKYDNGR